MNSNLFFKKKKVKAQKLFPNIKIKCDFDVNSVKPLHLASKKDITFFDSIKYKDEAFTTKAGLCITTESLKKHLPDTLQKIIVKNVLYDLAKVLKTIYPFSDVDYPDLSLKAPKKNRFKTVKFGNNVLVGLNVKIGKNSIIGSNSIIEKNVKIGKNCVIGSGVVIKNSLVGDRVIVQDNCKIGQKGFGFIPINKRNIKRETKKVVDDGKARNMYSSTKKSLTFKSIKSVGIGSATSNVTAQVINTGDGGDY